MDYTTELTAEDVEPLRARLLTLIDASDNMSPEEKLQARGKLGAPTRVATLYALNFDADFDTYRQAFMHPVLCDDFNRQKDAFKHASEVSKEVERLAVREEAKRQYQKETFGEHLPPEPVTLTELLNQESNPTKYRIESVWPMHSRVMFAAQAKAGKTTFVGNVLRSLVDGKSLLDTFDVQEEVKRVTLLDFEMSADMLREWLDAQDIDHKDRITVYAARGKAASFNILDDDIRKRWADKLRVDTPDVLVIDCIGPILRAAGIEEDKGGIFLVHLDMLLTEAGIGDCLVVHHMGHNGERSRGDSYFRGWPEVEWKLVKNEDDPAIPRYFSAYGRDVDVHESELGYNTLTRHLTMIGGSRRQAATRGAMPDLIQLLSANTGVSASDIETQLMVKGHGRKAIRDTVKQAIRQGTVITRPGARNSVLHAVKTITVDDHAAN